MIDDDHGRTVTCGLAFRGLVIGAVIGTLIRILFPASGNSSPSPTSLCVFIIALGIIGVGTVWRFADS